MEKAKIENLQQEIKKSQLQAQTEYEFDLIKRKHPHLLPVGLTKTEMGINFEFETKGFSPLSGIKNKNEIDLLRTLLNVLNFYELYRGLKFDLDPENLYQNIALHVKIAYRDVYGKEDVVDEGSFVKEFLCLLGALMQEKYTYHQFKESGVELLTKEKATKPFSGLKEISEVEAALTKALVEAKKKQEETLVSVSKSQFKKLKWTSRIALGTTAIFLAFSVYLHFHQNRFLHRTNEGFSAYIRSDFVETVDVLSGLNLNRMDHMMMYTLASAYIRTEALTAEQRDHILAGVNPSSTERVLEFWVLLSQGEYEAAIDVARLLGNDDYLVYGYLRQRSSIELDPNLSGAQREEQLEAIDRQLEQFEVQHEQGLEEVGEDDEEELGEE